MIKNERQYRITKAQAEKFERALQQFVAEAREDRKTHPKLLRAQEDALRSQLADLQRELQEYEELQSGDGARLDVGSVEELPRMLIRARIAAGLTQKELGELIGVAEQQIQRYEATEYESASMSRVIEVARALSGRASKRGHQGVPGATIK